MVTLMAVYAVLLVAVVAMYFVSQRLRKGQRQGFWQWLKSGFTGQVVPTKQRPLEQVRGMSTGTAESPEVVTVLEDIYEEFVGEVEKLRKQFDIRLATLEQTWRAELHRVSTELDALRYASGLYSSDAEKPPLSASRVETPSLTSTQMAPLERRMETRQTTQEPVRSVRGYSQGLPSVTDAVGRADDTVPVVEELAKLDSVPTGVPNTAPLHTTPEVRGPARQGGKYGDTASVNQKRNSSEVYFEILDELHAGKEPAVVAKQLGVSLQEVERVRKIMESPGV